VQMPSVTLSANAKDADPTLIDVSWGSPGAMNFTVYVVTRGGTRNVWTTTRGNGSSTFHGKRGQTYWFWANATSDLGWSDAGGSDVVEVPQRTNSAAVSS